jgi:beta-galactosidase beta subunit
MTSPTKQNESPGRGPVASDHVTFNGETGTYWTEFDGHTRQPAEAVVYAVAEASQTDPLDLPPLYSVVDTDALNAIVETSTNSRSQTEITVSFEYADHHVILDGYGRIVITPPSAGER